MSAASKAKVIAGTIEASNLTDVDLVKLFRSTAAQPQTADVKVVLAGVITTLALRGLIALPA